MNWRTSVSPISEGGRMKYLAKSRTAPHVSAGAVGAVSLEQKIGLHLFLKFSHGFLLKKAFEKNHTGKPIGLRGNYFREKTEGPYKAGSIHSLGSSETTRSV